MHSGTPVAWQPRMLRGKRESTLANIQAQPRNTGAISLTSDNWTRVGGWIEAGPNSPTRAPWKN